MYRLFLVMVYLEMYLLSKVQNLKMSLLLASSGSFPRLLLVISSDTVPLPLIGWEFRPQRGRLKGAPLIGWMAERRPSKKPRRGQEEVEKGTELIWPFRVTKLGGGRGVHIGGREAKRTPRGGQEDTEEYWWKLKRQKDLSLGLLSALHGYVRCAISPWLLVVKI